MEPMATILETARIRLREFAESDLDTLATMEVGKEAAPSDRALSRRRRTV
jgi:hypothetical protein